MPFVTADDDVKLFYDEVGSEYPIVFVHEFAGDTAVRAASASFRRTYRCIAFNARGYPPSGVPKDGEHIPGPRA